MKNYIIILFLLLANLAFSQGKFSGGNGMGYDSAELLNQSLPVNMLFFSGESRGIDIELNWETGSELNNQGFAIQRRNYDQEFSTIGFVSGHENNTLAASFSFIDPNPVRGINYYRLWQMDFDGTNAYSEVIAVSFSRNQAAFQVSPNPFSTSINIGIEGMERGQKLQIMNVLGEVVFEAEHVPRELNLAGLRAGIYFVVIDGGAVKVLKK